MSGSRRSKKLLSPGQPRQHLRHGRSVASPERAIDAIFANIQSAA
jgi:hypothetical protein